jgi:hypothetical protein
MKGIDSKLKVGKFTSRDCPYSVCLLALWVLHVRSTTGSHCYDSSGFSFCSSRTTLKNLWEDIMGILWVGTFLDNAAGLGCEDDRLCANVQATTSFEGEIHYTCDSSIKSCWITIEMAGLVGIHCWTCIWHTHYYMYWNGWVFSLYWSGWWCNSELSASNA